jgi:DNA-binding response OmpR family regulator
VAPSLNILVIEDHDSLRNVIVSILNAQGHQTVGLASAEAVDDEAGGLAADLYLIDLNLPGEDGISLTQRIRRAHDQAGIIMVTARGQLQDKIDGYASGADIYLTKPVDTEELLAAIAALTRRIKPKSPALPELVLQLDTQRLLVTGPIEAVHITDADAKLLSALSKAAGLRLEFWQLNEALGQTPNNRNKASLEVRMTRLRKKLAQAGGADTALKAIRGHGYQLCVPLHLC